MLPLILAMFVIVGLVSAGYMLLGPAVQRGRTVQTLKSLDSIANSVILWSASSKTLPPALQTVFTGGNPLDPWNNNILYIFDSNLSSTATGGICGRTSTNLSANGTANIAFVLLSSAGDTIQSTWTGAPALVPATTSYSSSTPVTIVLNTGDIYKTVTLEELKSRAGCYGPTQGSLRILNNELPIACAGAAYNATIFPGGGVAPYTTLITGLPSGLSQSGSSIAGTPSVIGVSSVTAQVNDSHLPTATTIRKTFRLEVKSCGGSQGQTVSLANNITSFMPAKQRSGTIAVDTSAKSVTLGGAAGQNRSSACFWYPQTVALKNGFFRAYLEFRFNNTDNSPQSNAFGDGFVFALMNAPFLDRKSVV